MKNIYKIGTIAILTFISLVKVQAQNVEFVASAPKVVQVGEQFRLTYSLNAKGSDFQEPAFENFKVLTGPNISTSSSVQIVNGKMSQSVSYTYTFILMAVSEGNFTIPPANVTVNRKSVQSNQFTIEVVKGGQTSQTTSGGSSSNAVNKPTSGNSKVFVTIEVDKKSLYQGESLVAEIKLYTQQSLSGFEDIKFPPFTGFWSQDIESPQQIELHRENLNGQIYDVGLFKKVLLFPQRSGEITIDPFEITMIVQERVRSNNPFDDFFGGSYRRIPLKMISDPVKIAVKPLPVNAPAEFSGAVGKYSMTASIDKTRVKANEAITLKVKVTGTGNLKLIKPVKVDFPLDMDVYDPKTNLNTKTTNDGVTGNVTFDYLFIPRYAGTFRIAPIVFSYFDTGSKTYKTITSQEFEIEVERGTGDQETTPGIVQSLTKEDVKYIGKDIRFLKSGFSLKKKETIIYGTPGFYLAYMGSLLLFLAIIIFRRTQIKQNANQVKVKNRKANKVSRRRLKIASAHLKQNNSEKFYDEILKAIWGYLSDKLSIPVANLTKDNVSEILNKHQVDAETVGNLMQLLDACEFARYAPASVSGGMDEIYKQAEMVISKLDQKIK
ncbi:MAG TPA: hypothetical protein DCY97_00900 [Marinilabiliales bacterium]|jgi:hypothetical protein|nr:hypothetical protein [Marinilabiliales bacterium]